MPTNDEMVKRYSLEGFLRRHSFNVSAISISEIEDGCRAFESWEPRDSMYRVSTFLVREWWDDPARLVDALSVLLLVWNAAFYRFYGSFDEQALEEFLRQNQSKFSAFRGRDISSLSEADEADIQRLFNGLSGALKTTGKGVESPVSVGKALHLLAPNFFPLWDQYIAPAYCCPYTSEVPSVAYTVFSRRIRSMAAQLSVELAADRSSRKEWLSTKTLLKRIDEYNYMKYTVPNLSAAKKQRKTQVGPGDMLEDTSST